MKNKKLVIGLNITNIIVLIALILGVLFAVFVVSIIFAIFGQSVMNKVMLELFKYSLIVNAPNFFIIIVTIISLCAVLCRKEVKNQKKIEAFLVLHILCLVLSILVMIAPVCIGVFSLIKAYMQGEIGNSDWESLIVFVLFIALEGFSLMTNIFTVKYLNEMQRRLDYVE